MPVRMSGGSSGHSKENYLPPPDPSFDSQPVFTNHTSGGFPSTIHHTGMKSANRIGNELAETPVAPGHDLLPEVQGEQPDALNARFQRFAQIVAKGGPKPGHGVPTSGGEGGVMGEGGQGGGSILEPAAG